MYVTVQPTHAGFVLKAYHVQLNDKIMEISPEARIEFENDLEFYELALEGYRELISCESSIHRLKEVDIMSLEKQIHAQDELLPSLAEAAEKVSHLSYMQSMHLTCLW